MLDDDARNAIALRKFSLISPILNGQVNNRWEYYVQISSNPIEMPLWRKKICTEDNRVLVL